MGGSLVVAVFAFLQLRAQVSVDGRLFPGGIPEVAQHLSGPEQLFGEKSAPGKTRFGFAAEFSFLLQSVERPDLFVLCDNKLHHFRKHIVVVCLGTLRPEQMRRAQTALQIGRTENARFLKVTAVYPGMKSFVG